MDFILILLLLFLNGVFAMYEMALVSSSRLRISIEAERGSNSARRLLKQMDKPEQTLSAIQIGITLIGILSGALGSMALADNLEPLFRLLPVIGVYAHQCAVVTTIVAITYLSLVIGELVPKALALNNPEGYALKLSIAISVLTKVSFPAVCLLSVSTRFIQKLLGVKTETESGMSTEEIKMVIAQSGESGKLLPGQSDILHGAINLTCRKVCELMTPRPEMVVLSTSDGRKDILETIVRYNYSRYLLVGESKDDIKGIVLVKDIVKVLSSSTDDSPSVDLLPVATAPLYLPEKVSAFKALQLFRKRSTKAGVVIDEYGGIEGLVTLHDLTESIFGPLGDDGKPAERDVVALGDGRYVVDGAANIAEVFDMLSIPIDPGIEKLGFSTICGLSMSFIGRMPQKGDSFCYKGYHFEILAMDEERVGKLLVKPLAKMGEASSMN